MTVHNYYFVNKDTKKVHYLFKVDPYFMAKNDEPEAWLSGRLYFSDKDLALTLEELYSLDYSDDYLIPDISSEYPIFEMMAKIGYASYKGYRLYDFSDIQHYDDFAGNDLMEANAFLAELFKQYIGAEEIKKWGADNFADKYGINDIIMKHFTIEYDNDENIHLHPSLRNDSDEWNGFSHTMTN